jgi:hypothetical protein
MFGINSGKNLLLMVCSWLVLLLLLWSCDPGFDYRPRGWQTEDEYNYLWSSSFNGVELRTSGIWGLIGDRNISPEFEIHNGTEQLLSLESAELATDAGRYFGELPDGGAIEWRTVEPGSKGRFPVRWNTDESAIDFLGANPSVILTFRLGDELRQMEITYERIE